MVIFIQRILKWTSKKWYARRRFSVYGLPLAIPAFVSTIATDIRNGHEFRDCENIMMTIFNEFFFDQFSLESKYEIEIDMEINDRFFDMKFHELDVLLFLKDINPSKTAGPDGIHGMVLKIIHLL